MIIDPGKKGENDALRKKEKEREGEEEGEEREKRETVVMVLFLKRQERTGFITQECKQ